MNMLLPVPPASPCVVWLIICLASYCLSLSPCCAPLRPPTRPAAVDRRSARRKEARRAVRGTFMGSAPSSSSSITLSSSSSKALLALSKASFGRNFLPRTGPGFNGTSRSIVTRTPRSLLRPKKPRKYSSRRSWL